MNQKTLPNKALQEILDKLPTAPGVYRMFDASCTVIYVGKAKNLKNRVQSYFTGSDKTAKTKVLVEQISNIEVSVTRSETEALLLESQLIKTLKPKYNILMRDDKSYPYLYLSLSHEFPSLTTVRTKKNPNKKGYFGPFPSVVSVRETLNLIQKVFKLRNCRDSEFKARTRPCLQYQIKRCTAPCVGFASKEEYQHAVDDALQFLQGKSQALLKTLTHRMEEAALKLAFEEAARLRDQIRHLRVIQEQQGMTARAGDADIIVCDTSDGIACIECVLVREGQVVHESAFFPSLPKVLPEPHLLKQALIDAFLSHHYMEVPSRIPSLIVTDETLDNSEAWSELLSEKRERKCHVQTITRGPKMRWITFAKDNLKRALKSRMTSDAMIEARFKTLEAALKFDIPITRMVCFDISHTQGQDAVASCVVFDRKGPIKSAYRRLNMRDITPGDDYAAMHQAVSRYMKSVIKAHAPEPELLIIDGGKGQVGMAREALDELHLSRIRLLGVAKGVTRKAGLERLIVSDGREEMSLSPDSPALHLVQHIRDEAHRFAITAHRKKRGKTALSSTLLEIPGIGEKRRQALIQRFGGIRVLKSVSLEEIKKVEGISHALAEKIYRYLHN